MAQYINGRIEGKVGDKTYYTKNGTTFVRASRNDKKSKKRTSEQFKQMMNFQNRNQLWRVLSRTEKVYFEGDKSSPQRQFISVNNNLPHVYLPKGMNSIGTALLQPGMIVCDGPLSSFDCHLGEFQGEPALLTTLAEADAQTGQLLLYVFQQIEIVHLPPSIKTKVIDISQPTDEVKVMFCDGFLILTGAMFADDMSGFALAHIVNGHASRQTLVTRCTYYEQYTTEEALMKAAKSYGRVDANIDFWTITFKK